MYMYGVAIFKESFMDKKNSPYLTRWVCFYVKNVTPSFSCQCNQHILKHKVYLSTEWQWIASKFIS